MYLKTESISWNTDLTIRVRMGINKADINHYDEIIQDFLLDPETLGTLQGIINYYNRSFSLKELDEAILSVLKDVLPTGKISIERVYDVEKEIYHSNSFKNELEVLNYIKKTWGKMNTENPLWYYILFFENTMAANEYKKLLEKSAANIWYKISRGIEKLEHKANLGLYFIFKEDGENGRPVIETWKNERFVTKRIF